MESLYRGGTEAQRVEPLSRVPSRREAPQRAPHRSSPCVSQPPTVAGKLLRRSAPLFVFLFFVRATMFPRYSALGEPVVCCAASHRGRLLRHTARLALEQNRVVIQNKNTQSSTGNSIYKLSTCLLKGEKIPGGEQPLIAYS